ncbi:Gfo/Idh/MocA family oxidoreductase [Chitinophaga pendula]|uniref:Gfo/Idh/MocA family protein n=1 Tax=Chitinophaga TaxID=79328 RepID=UPI000BB08A7A|nr:MULTISPECIES: Gfo/Idh/MocA family oxidoreductase [Chitinophaga]ASZ10423.1 oxidoreductase [Chitinophaga sp. MD30]UCJ06609.1 Gfo/Idh/MocA family oxidoreductase [Chitinophaga pendula]
MDRRQFLANGAAIAAGFTILPRHVLGGPGYIAPSDKLNIAAIGAGGKGSYNIQQAFNNGSDNIVALCDVDDRQAQDSRQKHPKAKYYKDFRTLLEKERKNIDAVMVSTPDHMHAVIAMAAMQLGKHVYVEKPLTHDIYEARMLTQAAQRYKVVTQMGNQGSSGDDTRLIEAYINIGVIGQVQQVHCWTNRPVWPQGIPTPKNKMTVPAGVDWDLWIGTAPMRDYNEAYMPFRWRGWWDFGTGALGDMACHIMDVPFRALELGYPSSVECSAGSVFEDFFKEAALTDSCPPSSVIYFNFPARGEKPPVTLTWYDGGILPRRPAELSPDEPMGDWDGGMIFEGTEGKIIAGMWGKNPTVLPASKAQSLPRIKIKPVDGGAEGHQQQWVQACKKGFGAYTSSPFSSAGPLTETILLGNLALRSYFFRQPSTNGKDFSSPGRKQLQWNGKDMRIANFDNANQYVKREYRAGWKL